MISSTFLYHFTPKFEWLKSIIKDGFKVSYSQEDYKWLNKKTIPFKFFQGEDLQQRKIKLHIPMVCFSDIPSNLISEHVKTYGGYGIGLNDKFKSTYKLNPLFYLKDRTDIASTFYLIESISAKLDTNDPNYALRNQINRLLCFIKPYEGLFEKNSNTYENYKYYDEREWRFIPPSTEIPVLSETEYKNQKEQRHSFLEFNKEHIEVIIVKSLQEKEKIQNLVNNSIEVHTLKEFSTKKM